MPNGFIVEFAGICCHYDPIKRGIANPPYKMRTIVLDARNANPSHLPHLEVQAMGVKDDSQWGPPLGIYLRRGIAYQNYALDQLRLTIDPTSIAATSTTFSIQPGYTDGVPTLPDVCQYFGDLETTHYLDSDPNTSGDIVAAHFDMMVGSLDIGEQTTKMTRFTPPYHWPPPNGLAKVPFPRAVHLTLNTTGYTTIIGQSFSNPLVIRKLILNDWAGKIRIGNLTATGRLGGTEMNEQHHFMLYYAMAAVGHPNDPIPEDDIQDDRGLGGGCSNTNFP